MLIITLELLYPTSIFLHGLCKRSMNTDLITQFISWMKKLLNYRCRTLTTRLCICYKFSQQYDIPPTHSHIISTIKILSFICMRLIACRQIYKSAILICESVYISRDTNAKKKEWRKEIEMDTIRSDRYVCVNKLTTHTCVCVDSRGVHKQTQRPCVEIREEPSEGPRGRPKVLLAE